MRGVSASASASSPPATAFSALRSKPKSTPFLARTPNLKLDGVRFREQRWSRSLSLRCNNSSAPGEPVSGDDESSKMVLDAFFLGKALAEAVTERIESSMGEILSTVVRLQAEQQQNLQEFQEDVLERAKRAQEKAAHDALNAQGLATKATTTSNLDDDILVTSTSPNTTGDPTMDLFRD